MVFAVNLNPIVEKGSKGEVIARQDEPFKSLAADNGHRLIEIALSLAKSSLLHQQVAVGRQGLLDHERRVGSVVVQDVQVGILPFIIVM